MEQKIDLVKRSRRGGYQGGVSASSLASVRRFLTFQKPKTGGISKMVESKEVRNTKSKHEDGNHANSNFDMQMGETTSPRRTREGRVRESDMGFLGFRAREELKRRAQHEQSKKVRRDGISLSTTLVSRGVREPEK